MTPPQKLVILALSEHADESGDCWPSLTRLSVLTGLARSTVAEALNALEAPATRLIARDRGEHGRSTRYRLLMGGPRDATGCRREAPGEQARGAEGSPADGLATRPEIGPVRSEVVRQPDQDSPPRGLSSPGAGLAVVREPDPNRQLNRQEPPVNRHCSAAPPTQGERHGRRGKAIRIPRDWWPSDRVFDWAGEQGMTREWVADQIDEFVVYWSDRGEARKSWDATFMNRLRDLHERPSRGNGNGANRQPDPKDFTLGATRDEDLPEWCHDWPQAGLA